MALNTNAPAVPLSSAPNADQGAVVAPATASPSIDRFPPTTLHNTLPSALNVNLTTPFVFPGTNAGHSQLHTKKNVAKPRVSTGNKENTPPHPATTTASSPAPQRPAPQRPPFRVLSLQQPILQDITLQGPPLQGFPVQGAALHQPTLQSAVTQDTAPDAAPQDAAPQAATPQDAAPQDNAPQEEAHQEGENSTRRSRRAPVPSTRTDKLNEIGTNVLPPKAPIVPLSDVEEPSWFAPAYEYLKQSALGVVRLDIVEKWAKNERARGWKSGKVRYGIALSFVWTNWALLGPSG